MCSWFSIQFSLTLLHICLTEQVRSNCKLTLIAVCFLWSVILFMVVFLVIPPELLITPRDFSYSDFNHFLASWPYICGLFMVMVPWLRALLSPSLSRFLLAISHMRRPGLDFLLSYRELEVPVTFSVVHPKAPGRVPGAAELEQLSYHGNSGGEIGFDSTICTLAFAQERSVLPLLLL